MAPSQWGSNGLHPRFDYLIATNTPDEFAARAIAIAQSASAAGV